jgi:hypothetical protein
MSQRDPLDELEAALFSAGRRERPLDDVRARALDAALAIERGAHERDGGPAAEHSVSTRSRRRRYAIAFGIAAALAALAVGVARFRSSRDPVFAIGPEPSSQAKHTPPESSAEQREKQSASTPPSPEPVREKTVVPRTVPHAAHEPATPAATEEKPAASLPEEIAALDRVRSALSAGDTTAALRGLDDYERVLHGTRLTAEAAVLRIDALARSGRAREASGLARRFVEANPGSALAERARTFILRNESSGVDAGALR